VAKTGYTIDTMTQWQLLYFAEEYLDSVVVTVFVTPEEAGILLLADGVNQGIGVSLIMSEVMRVLSRLEFIKNIGARSGRTACHRFTDKANARLRFEPRQDDERWIFFEQSKGLHAPQWRSDLERVAGPQAAIVRDRYMTNRTMFQARCERNAVARRSRRTRLRLV
jgi:hypothetical protein